MQALFAKRSQQATYFQHIILAPALCGIPEDSWISPARARSANSTRIRWRLDKTYFAENLPRQATIRETMRRSPNKQDKNFTSTSAGTSRGDVSTHRLVSRAKLTSALSSRPSSFSPGKKHVSGKYADLVGINISSEHYGLRTRISGFCNCGSRAVLRSFGSAYEPGISQRTPALIVSLCETWKISLVALVVLSGVIRHRRLEAGCTGHVVPHLPNMSQARNP